MRSIDDLLQEAKYGQLDKDEISYVAQKVKESTPNNNIDLYGLIYILGLSGAKEHRKLLESFLYYPSFPMISGMALKALCTYWNEAHNYLDQIKAFIKGVDWDKDEDVRLAAVHCAGAFLSQTPEKELLLLLFSIYSESNDIANTLEDSKDPDERSAFSRAAFWCEVTFQALALAVGRSMSDFILLPEAQKNHLEDDPWENGKFVESVLEEVVQLIERLD